MIMNRPSLASLSSLAARACLFCMILLLHACGDHGDELAWRDFPDNPGYTRQEQIHYLRAFPLGFGEAGSLINDENRISEENIRYLIRIAEKRLSYNDLGDKTAEELILISAHLTQHILKPHTPENWHQRTVIAYNTNNDFIERRRRWKRKQRAMCINFTLLNMYIFEAFKERYPALDRYAFIPVSVTGLNHAIQGFYDRERDRLAVVCGMTDAKDGRFNAGKHRLNWTKNQPDLYHENHVDFIRVVKHLDGNPRQVIDELGRMKDNEAYVPSHATYYIALAYNRLGDNKTANRLLFDILRYDPVFGSLIITSIFM